MSIRIPYCLELLVAIEADTDCKKTSCVYHLLFDGLKLSQDQIRKTEKYYNCWGCGAFDGSEPWRFEEIGELWGWSKQRVCYHQESALAKLRRKAGRVGL